MSDWHKYSWTAFTEEDLLNAGSGNGTSIGYGDKFTMPGSASVTMSTWDNDGSLSGDNYHNENANDGSGQYARVDGARVGSQMYAESYHVLHGSDGKTYYLIEIEVEGYDAPGTGDDFFTFYGAVPPAGVELTVANKCNVKGHWVDYKCLSAGDTAPPNTPPHFTNVPSDGIICIDENTTFVIDLNADDADGDALTYEIVGGRDAAFFEINEHTGELSFIGAPDYEDPQSGGNSNTYDVTVKVADGNGGHQTKALWVKVKDVDEPTGECIVIEAEDMHKWGFHTVSGSQASGGELVKINCKGGTGDLSTTFQGESGEYDFTVRVQDESDGQSTIMVKVNGHVVGTIELDHDNNGGGSNNGGFSERTIENIQINKGDTITLWAQADGCEFVRIDKIELCKDGEACPDGFSLQDFSGVATGVTVSDQFDGFTVTAQRAGDDPASENDAMIFDTANPTGGDFDLGFANQGNAIIISEDNDASNPDDNAGGGTISFHFDNPSDLHDVKLLDIEGSGTSIELFDADGNLIKTIDVNGAGDNTAQTVLLDATGVSKMVVNLHTSGAVDDLCFKPGDPPPLGALSGRYFCDDNRDGLDNDANNAVAGVTVTLLDAAGDPVTDAGGTPVTTVTDADGNYRFDDLEAGTYGVRFESTPVGKELTAQNVGTDDAIDSDASDTGGGTSSIFGIGVVAGEETTDNDVGVLYIPGSLSGRYFCDENGDNLDNDGANGVAGVSVMLLDDGGNPAVDAEGNPVAAVVTGADGSYCFANLAPGTYSVKFTDAVSGGALVDANVGADDTIDSDAADLGGGMSQIDNITVLADQDTPDNDAGVKGTASVGDQLFYDNNRNGIRDAGDTVAAGIGVALLDSSGAVLATTTSDGSGMYLFDGLKAGDYAIQFDAIDDFIFTTEGADADDATNDDSDADQTTGRTDVFTLDIGEAERDIDAGYQAVNNDPDPMDDMGKVCADELLTVDVLANDSDPDGDTLLITAVDGQAISEGGSVMTSAGTVVSLVGGQLVFDGEAAYAALDIGEEATETISYTIDDGNGGSASADVEVTFCGDANSVGSLSGSLPSSVSYQIADGFAGGAPYGDFGYDIRINTAEGDARFEGVVFEEAYCLDFLDPAATARELDDAPVNTADMFGADDPAAPGVFDAGQVGINGQSAADNLDLITYILNKDYENNGTGSVDGNFTGWEVQFAIWELTNSVDSDLTFDAAPSVGQVADVDFIVADAIANGEGFTAGVGDVVGVILDPNPATNDNAQPFIIGINFEDYDCIC